MVSGEKIQEVLFLLQKDAERVVSGRTFWRPAMYREIKAASRTNTIARRHAASWDQFVDEVKDEYNVKVDYMKRNAKPFYRALVSLKKDIVSTYHDIKADAVQMYNNNEFRMKDINSWVQNAKEWTG